MRSSIRKPRGRYLAILRTVAFGAALCSAIAGQPYTFRHPPGGAWSPFSEVRTLVAPCHSKVSAVVSGSRIDHWADDFLLNVEFRRPDVPVASPASFARAFWVRPTLRTETYTVDGHNPGCGTPWHITLRPEAVTRETRIEGSFSVKFNNAATNLSIEDAALLLNTRSTNKNLGGSGGLHQGWIDITGTWNHSVYGVPGPLPVKLTFSLVKPNGDIAAFDTGHSNHEVNPFASGDKLRLRFLIREHITGQWKLRITNDSGQDAMTIIPRGTYKPACQ